MKNLKFTTYNILANIEKLLSKTNYFFNKRFELITLCFFIKIKRIINMISKELFTKIINELLEDYNRGFEKDRLLTKAFGGDSSVFQENILLDRMLKILKEEFNDEYDFIDWLFFECLVNGRNLSFTYDEKEYEGNIENVYNYLIKKL